MNDPSISPAARTRPYLVEEDGRLKLVRSEGEPVSVKVVRPLPLSDPAALVFLDDEGTDVLRVTAASELDDASQTLLATALGERYNMPRIMRVTRADTIFGTHYWSVQTEQGDFDFALKEPGKNVTWLNEQHLVIRDTVGNRFEIVDLQALDPASRARVLAVL